MLCAIHLQWNTKDKEKIPYTTILHEIAAWCFRFLILFLSSSFCLSNYLIVCRMTKKIIYPDITFVLYGRKHSSEPGVQVFFLVLSSSSSSSFFFFFLFLFLFLLLLLHLLLLLLFFFLLLLLLLFFFFFFREWGWGWGHCRSTVSFK